MQEIVADHPVEIMDPSEVKPKVIEFPLDISVPGLDAPDHEPIQGLALVGPFHACKKSQQDSVLKLVNCTMMQEPAGAVNVLVKFSLFA